MKNKKIRTFFICLLLIFSIGMIGILLLMNGADKVKEADTVRLSVTVQRISSQGLSKDDGYITIGTYEYLYPFQIPDKFSSLLQSDRLEPGDKIYLRIKKSDAEQLNHLFVINAVELSDDDGVFFSIDDYNQYVHESITPTRIAAIAASLVLFVGAVSMINSTVKAFKKEKLA